MRKNASIRRRPGARRRVGRRLPLTRNPQRVGGPNTCKIIETLPAANIIANQSYVFDVGGIFPGGRAAAVAEQFGLYRVAKCMFRYKPNSDTYVSNPAFIGGSGAITVPYLYWKMNRFADAPAAFTANDLKNMGAKAIRFDDKTVTHSYKPNILTGIVSGGTNSGQLKMTPWLNTDAAPDTANFALSTTQHYGHFFVVEAAVAGAGSQPVGTIEVTIVYEFKNPRVKYTSQEQGALPTQSVSSLMIAAGHSPQV